MDLGDTDIAIVDETHGRGLSVIGYVIAVTDIDCRFHALDACSHLLKSVFACSHSMEEGKL